MELEEMKRRLAKELPEKRFKHSVAVCETAIRLARIHGVDEKKAAIAGLIHDSGRQIPTRDFIAKAEELGIDLDEIERCQPILIHSKLGKYYAQHEFGVTDPDILNAIRYHTTGAAHMSPLCMVIYLADLLEPARDFPKVEEMRKMAKKSLETTMLAAYANTMEYLLGSQLLIHPDCLAGYNELAIQLKKPKNNRS
ncbi:bis(5'-nucleosyl)-tetraphosphatase (symmetrical) YqeK [Acidaminococcus sp. NSJ-142]|jgi:predicted HD superfamily hydrolase involved in NAD metabolism|uniref:bis(5'-nucleosyl)-tetraphosphatase (symmetrical) YqeK n=1 Tax=Acidaminococcus TaxID=904 RepID=UPI000CFA1D62|nr:MULTISPECIES: bis(5'-nucleosyl)-tetraphosphatase (symmetrical) YqeK [Acidaminococcus]MCD2434578.1 bis(5'-nucleosyl)-tetraphosphatase (symmetrical) YqeK [Acidaminococcus hominis]MCH4096968.1 bis(5'-nucleosyl)-tetraphosphatase (symmetrical) YqeK [Acidaminococcus provencensis]RHK03852.1 HD domain-containing protein [Acidaminococcus sp. AM05-11]